MGEKKLSIPVCEEIVRRLLRTPKISHLVESIYPRAHISCSDTSEPDINARAFLRNTQPLQIELCVNKLHQVDIEEALIHELVHAFDYAFKRYDFSTCKGLAFSEVRAAREAECSSYKLSRWLRDRCIKHNAVRATSNIFPENAAECVEKVYSAAMNDLQPFEARDSK
jgi:hypothetical protein